MKQPVAYVAGADIQAIIKPYLTTDGLHFATDFFMTDRMAAMAGASVAEYGRINVELGSRGAFGNIADGRKPAHLFVLKPDSPDDAGVMTSPGTPDCVDGSGNVWNPLGASYIYDPTLRSYNFVLWCRAGAPKWNDFGDWSQSGVPLGYYEETWKGVKDRDLNQPGWPGYRPGGHRWPR